jgi:chloramphenicol-sensitive protein RarD
MTSSSAVAGDAAAGERGSQERAAIVAGLLCYFFWGFFPLLFKAASWAGAGAWEMVAWRTVWALAIAAALTFATGRTAEVRRVLASRRTLGLLCLSGVTIGFNWSLFVWAVNAGHTLDASLGYYLNPLLSVAAGLVLFRERIGRAGWAAIALASIGVAVQTVALGTLPFAALGMATSFCLYGIIRKHVVVDALVGFTFECVVLAGPALAYGLMLQAKGVGHAAQPLAGFLMFLAGPASVAPLVTFAWAARRMPLSTMGFLQFISPTLQFIVALATGEPLKPLSLVAFGFIWAGVAVYAVTAWRKLRTAEAFTAG